MEYTVTSQWEGGFQGGVKVTNLGDAVSGWQLKFTLPGSGQKVVQGWNATWSQSGSAVTAAGVDWNGSLASGGTADLGFVGSFSGANPAPTGFTLNGVACTGTVGGGGDDDDPPPATGAAPRWRPTVSSTCAARACATSTTVRSSCAA